MAARIAALLRSWSLHASFVASLSGRRRHKVFLHYFLLARERRATNRFT